MSKRIEHQKGDEINCITYIRELPAIKNYRYGIFRCKCGSEFKARIANIRSGNTKSCGCIHHQLMNSSKNPYFKHGDSNKNYLYQTWCSIKQRCYNNSYKEYYNYGGRGIKMYIPWKYNYILFKLWILENLGNRPEGYSLDRINNDGNYEPGNIRWATYKQQANNRRKRRS